jgi:hypothetical protein
MKELFIQLSTESGSWKDRRLTYAGPNAPSPTPDAPQNSFDFAKEPLSQKDSKELEKTLQDALKSGEPHSKTADKLKSVARIEGGKIFFKPIFVEGHTDKPEQNQPAQQPTEMGRGRGRDTVGTAATIGRLETKGGGQVSLGDKTEAKLPPTEGTEPTSGAAVARRGKRTK